MLGGASWLWCRVASPSRRELVKPTSAAKITPMLPLSELSLPALGELAAKLRHAGTVGKTKRDARFNLPHASRDGTDRSCYVDTMNLSRLLPS